MNHQSALEKLQEGQRLLQTAADDPYRLSAVLLKLHGALEDRLRDLLASRLPHMSAEIRDSNVFKWNQILEHAQSYLGLSREDSDFINQANRYRIPLAHGGAFTWNRAGLVQYEQLIRQIWDTGSRSGRVQPYPRQQYDDQQYNRERLTPPRQNTSPSYYRKPWYRSTVFYLFLFVFLTPIWGLLMITDRKQSCLVKSFALILIFGYAAGLYFLWNFLPLADYWNKSVVLVPTQNTIRTAVPTQSFTPTHKPQTTNTKQQIQPSNTAANGCRIEWIEYQGNDLANKSRAMVWTEIVSQQVNGSGMDAKQFYQQVVEKNPSLKTDGYVFLQGKKYLLPVCR